MKKTPSNRRLCIAECHRNVRKSSGVESAPGIQNKIFSSHFLPSLHLPPNWGLSPLSQEKVAFLFQILQSLAGAPSAQCSLWGFRVLTTLLFRLSSPGRSSGSLSLTFHVVLRGKMAVWQWLLNVLLARLARIDTGSERSSRMPRFCWNFRWS